MKWQRFKLANATLLILLHSFAWQIDIWPPFSPRFFPKISEKTSQSAIVADGEESLRHHKSFWKIYVPNWFGKIIASHIEKMHEAGYFKEICLKDFDHGHLLPYFAGDKEDIRSPRELLTSVHSILYHTQEKTKKWERERARDLSSKECTPRSIVGFMNGSICPAKNYCDESHFAKNPYHDSGTISDATIKEVFGISRINKEEYITIKEKAYSPSFMLNIVLEKNGRYKVAGQKYDIHLTLIEK